MKTYHLFLLLKTLHEAGPAEDLLSLGITPGQLSRLIIEASHDGFLIRDRQSLILSEKGIAQFKALRARENLIRPDGKWIKESKVGKLDTTKETEIYVPRTRK